MSFDLKEILMATALQHMEVAYMNLSASRTGVSNFMI